ncbi:MAG: 6-carboxytetrahydropterin synthase [Sedimentisphaerales bacterium]
MHKLSRQIRFAIEPFADSAEIGANSYCAKPTSNGLSLFFALWVELAGQTSKNTGFVVNVSDIDKIVREKGIIIFDNFIKNKFGKREQVTFEQIGQLLSTIWRTIEKDFLPAKISSLFVELMPARKLGIKENGGNMLYFSEKFEFSASHTLWNDKFSDEENEKIFGKCANKCGHGHNYIVEVTIKKSSGGELLKAGDFERTVQQQFINVVDHKNLNADVGHFKKVNPTVENIAEFAFKSLADKLKPMELDCITVWENDRTFCNYRAD